ncbi:hypothetical protein [Paractinoplanes globisporus]|jgi:hypothetical protein|uniref:Uncharacterized protein n=1 Tax=Paractinoplanes globisporus TaxID=113565 RepID=A0ABW6WHF7_9ACTN|nr:hypothetical protein [Actinoplanes globisporus]
MSTRGRAIAISIAALVVIGVVAVIIAVTRSGDDDAKASSTAAAESAVRGFFTALTAGDAKTALTYLEPPPGFDPATDPLLTDAALGAGHRPEAVQYGAPRLESGLTFVDVTYQARGEAVQQAVSLSGSGGSFRVRDVLVGLTATGVEGRPVSVNGVKMGTDDLNVGVFPGSYEVAVAGNALFEGETLTVVPQVAMGGETAAANFGPPDLTGTATAGIQSQVRKALDKCAASSSAKTKGCPFWLDAKGKATVKWSIKTYPTVKAQVVNVASGPTVSLSADGKGKVHWSGTYVDASGHSRFGGGDIPFSIAGSATATASGIKVSLTT